MEESARDPHVMQGIGQNVECLHARAFVELPVREMLEPHTSFTKNDGGAICLSRSYDHVLARI